MKVVKIPREAVVEALLGSLQNTKDPKVAEAIANYYLHQHEKRKRNIRK